MDQCVEQTASLLLSTMCSEIMSFMTWMPASLFLPPGHVLHQHTPSSSPQVMFSTNYSMLHYVVYDKYSA